MKQIEENIDEFVRKLKRDEALADCRFVKGFTKESCENPITKYTIAVSTLDTQISTEFMSDTVDVGLKGRMYKVAVRFRIYAPNGSSGSGLAQLVGVFGDAVNRCDSSNISSQIKSSGVSYDPDTRTVYRDVTVTFDYCLYEEAAQ